MARVHVKPSGGQWRVTRAGKTKSNHYKKSRAVAKARRVAKSGDQLIIQRQNGTVQQNSRVR